MTPMAYQGARDICRIHAERLRWSLDTLRPLRPLTAEKLTTLRPMDLAVCDQFITRFCKLQDTMATKLFPAVLELTRESGDLSAFIVKLNRLEKIGAIGSAQQWLTLREMRNQFAHDYLEDFEIQASLLNRAFNLAEEMMRILEEVNRFAERYL